MPSLSNINETIIRNLSKEVILVQMWVDEGENNSVPLCQSPLQYVHACDATYYATLPTHRAPQGRI